MAEIWHRPWALVEVERRHRTVLIGENLEVGPQHAAALWLYEPNGERAQVNGRFDVTEPVPGFGSNDDTRQLGVIPFPLRNRPGNTVSIGAATMRINWPSAPERPPSKLDPQTDQEKEGYRLMLRAKAVWDRLRDVERALSDPAQLWPELRRRWTKEGDNIPPSMPDRC